MKIRVIILFFGLFLGVLLTTAYLASSQLRDNTIEYGRKVQNPKKIMVTDLINSDDLQVSKNFFEGKWTMITFGFTNCPDVCPTALASFRDEIKLLSEDEEKVQFVFVSVDPERDSPRRLKEYKNYFHKDIVAITGSEAELRKFAKPFGVYFEKEEPTKENDYAVSHSPQFFLISPEAELYAMYSPPLGRGKIAMDMSRLAQDTFL